MIKRQKDIQHNDQKTEGHTTQWSKEKDKKSKTTNYTENLRLSTTNPTKYRGSTQILPMSGVYVLSCFKHLNKAGRATIIKTMNK
jgi:hypothetical protein